MGSEAKQIDEDEIRFRAHRLQPTGTGINPDSAGFYRMARLQGARSSDPVQPAKKCNIEIVATGNLFDRIALLSALQVRNMEARATGAAVCCSLTTGSASSSAEGVESDMLLDCAGSG